MIGIFGGTFNPIHNGHLQLAKQALDRLALDHVHFLPCANPVHRGAPKVNSHDRLNMIKLSIANEDQFVVNTLELDRGGASFMIDTLREVRELHPNESIGLLLGADTFNDILSWKQPTKILELAHLIVCQRPEIMLNRNIFNECWVESVDRLQGEKFGHVLPLAIKQSSCSSTEIRQQLAVSVPTSESVISCLPKTVLEYIVNNHLYET
ncbi:MAG: nicotinate-nucleotide adenylyltransferase [Gammaproteobacteria bacterium]|jgi:nicotinate-nucleotide adenylyltransferase